jgi:hypothetical protein
MADPKKPPPEPSRRRPKKPDGDGGDDVRRHPHEEQGDAVRIHEAYLEHRLAGGGAPDPEAHLRAIEEFERLPGALRTTPRATPDESSGADEKADDEPADRGPER